MVGVTLRMGDVTVRSTLVGIAVHTAFIFRSAMVGAALPWCCTPFFREIN